MDIDNFKKFNDTYGHQIGDEVLKKVAGIVNSCSNACPVSEKKNQCIAGRYGGEELVVMIKHLKDYQQAIEYAEWIRGSVEKTSMNAGTKIISVTLSLGVAAFKKNTSAAKLIQQADQALYRAKNLGKNRVCLAMD